MSERPSFNSDQDKEAKAQAALEQAEKLAAQEEAERAKAQETGDQDLGISKGDLDDFEAGMDNLFAEDDDK